MHSDTDNISSNITPTNSTSTTGTPPTGTEASLGSPSHLDVAKAERGLKGAALFSVISGLFFASASTGPTDGLMRLFLDSIFWRIGDGPAVLSDSHHLVDAITGGVMVGWGAMTWLVVDRFISASPGDVKQIVGVAIAAWFVVDSAGSIASGGWLNAVFNVAYAALFLLPLRKL